MVLTTSVSFSLPAMTHVQALNKHQPHLVVVEPVVWCLSIFAAARPITLRRLNVVEVRALPPHFFESPVLAP